MFLIRVQRREKLRWWDSDCQCITCKAKSIMRRDLLETLYAPLTWLSVIQVFFTFIQLGTNKAHLPSGPI